MGRKWDESELLQSSVLSAALQISQKRSADRSERCFIGLRRHRRINQSAD